MINSKRVILIQTKKQSGVIIVVAMIMLLVMTGIGVTVMTGSTLQERMAGNNRQLSIARSNAESALIEAEAEIAGWDTNFFENFSAEFEAGDAGRYISVPENYRPSTQGRTELTLKAAPADNYLLDVQAWKTTAVTSEEAVVSSGVALAPRYVIEFIGSQRFSTKADINVSQGGAQNISPSYVFRITAVGYGRDPNISSVLQSIYTTGQ